MPTRRRPPQHQMPHVVRIPDRIVQSQEPPKAPAADDNFFVLLGIPLAGEMGTDPLDVVDDLRERVGLGRRAPAVSPVVEGEDAVTIAAARGGGRRRERAVGLEVGAMIACLVHGALCKPLLPTSSSLLSLSLSLWGT